MIQLFRKLKKTEKIIVAFLLLVILVSVIRIGRAFYIDFSDTQPIKGGLYTEGMVGRLGALNPLFIQYGSPTHDLTQLIFSGLTKYDPKTGEIVPDLADFKVSENKLEYTFVIKENAKWHDGKPVTSNDIIFTYNTVINDPAFNGTILNYNDYNGVKIVKSDERTIRFLLEEPDSFFLVKTIVGILPEHLLLPLPVENLDQASFNFSPIGTGPYRFTTIKSDNQITEVTLEAFEDYYGGEMNIPTLRFKIYETFSDLSKDFVELDVIRNIPSENLPDLQKKDKYSLIPYHLPQYVALFMNTESPLLNKVNTRLGLQIGTNKKELIKTLNEGEVIDTPLLEIDQKNWVHQYSVSKANGALKDAGWEISEAEKKALVTQLNNDKKIASPSNEAKEEKEVTPKEEVEEPAPIYINSPNGGKDFETDSKRIIITGTTPSGTKQVFINDYQLNKFIPGNKTWSYIASFEFKNLKEGKNEFNVYFVDEKGNKTLGDTQLIYHGTKKALEEKSEEVIEIENDSAPELPIRKNIKGDALSLKLVTPKKPETYLKIAKFIQKDWKKMGVNVEIEALEGIKFQEAVFKRKYDLLVFGQNLGYNLDAYPYWHSTQAKEGGYNLSSFKNFIVDSFLEKARYQHNKEARLKSLNQAQEIISKEVPAIFLYRPTYHLAASGKIKNMTVDHLANISDRFGGIQDWYAKVKRTLNKKEGALGFFSWIIDQL